MSRLQKNLTADVQHANNKCESLGPGQKLIHHGRPPAIAATFSPHMAFFRRLVFPNMHFQCCMLLQGTLGGDFDIFAASGESAAWVLLWKNRSRPTGVRVCPVAHFNFFSTAFDPRAWTMVVFWKEDSGRQLPLITSENEGGDETSSTSPPKFTSFDDPDVPFRPRPRGPFDHHRGPYPDHTQDPPDDPGFPPRITSSSSTCWWREHKSGGSIA